jgi:glutamate synthase domain-containing protein 1
VGTKDSMLYLSSEESAIRLVCPDLDDAWIPSGGEPIIGSLRAPLAPATAPRAEEMIPHAH